jgi:flagellar biosynthetic protein FlhB
LGSLTSVLPIMLAIVVVAILANCLQVGAVWSVEPLAPKASKIDPLEGAKRIFSKRSFVELAKSLAKIIIVGWAAFSVLDEEIGRLGQLMYQENVQIMRYLGETSFKVMTRSCYIIAILALLDYLYQRWEFEQNIKMTKQEVKEEFKQTEGDPLVKARIRSIQREMARRRMMEEVKKADVIITNPTHISVALRYDVATMTAPKVVAKGAEKLAFRIREVAQAHRVPLVENKGLAQNLYKSVDIGREIPSELYRAVAEVLAYVYGLKGRSV